ncbi:protein of unknown function [Nitrospira japonica]|uniref:Uncharacterized protein n=1 Tax=Nitrospira japonica TaxID=1325564 RepID=A0A1W1I366_9BACT|nr:ATP-grasp fold amidoligase family protein [Nitrospira japonica]SLM47450.1 protein of unknown function [Nitrospira japonica]
MNSVDPAWLGSVAAFTGDIRRLMIARFIHQRLRRLAVTLYGRGIPSRLLDAILYPTYLFQFLEVHNRLPVRPNRLFNDFLFKIKSGSELKHPLRRLVTDKELGKIYIEKKLGRGVTPRTHMILRSAAAVDRDTPSVYPSVVKPTHCSGRIVIVRSASEYAAASPTIKNWLQEDYFLDDLEKNYVGLERKVIVEEYIDDSFVLEGSLHCLNGEPKVISLIDRTTKSRQSFDVNAMPLGVSLHFPLQEFEPKSWEFLPQLLESARILASEFDYVRVDFYTDTTRILFGELTHLPAGGTGKFYPANGEMKFSEAFFRSPH